ncbi:MAG: hypothetical protein QM661_03295 [Solimonas sp.]
MPKAGTIPDSVLRLAAAFRHLIVVDLPRARLYLLQNDGGELKLVRNQYAAMARTAGASRAPATTARRSASTTSPAGSTVRSCRPSTAPARSR